jgi:hypothetical protein
MNHSDENWALAHSIELTPSRDGLKPGCIGVVVAERHPTGWFIAARFVPELSAELIEDFAHFVVVRTYLLLEYGPQPGVWDGDRVGVWHAYCRTCTAGPVNLPLIMR